MGVVVVWVWWCGCDGMGMPWHCISEVIWECYDCSLSLSWSSMFHREAMINALYAAFWSEGVSGVSID